MKEGQSKYNAYAFEGLDGTGKSTAGRLLAEQTGNKYLYAMDGGNRLHKIKDYFEHAPNIVRFLYYTAFALDTNRRVEELKERSDVYVDRTMATTIAYHKAYGLPETVFRVVPKRALDQFEQMVYFTLEPETRKQRLLNRVNEGTPMTVSDIKSLEFDQKIDGIYRTLMPERTTIVPVDNKTPEQVVFDVKKKLYG